MGCRVTNLVSKYVSDESGATAIEYGLLAALIGIAIIGGARLFSTRLTEQFGFVSNTLTTG